MVEGPILVVDDSQAILDTLRQVLERMGVETEEILTAERRAEAMKLFKEHRPSIVFMDVDLGGEKGDQAAMQILNLEPSTKVVLMTGLDLGDPRVRAVVSAGAYEVIQKPLRLARIQQVFELIASEERGYRRV